jgi:hypothetical protein
MFGRSGLSLGRRLGFLTLATLFALWSNVSGLSAAAEAPDSPGPTLDDGGTQMPARGLTAARTPPLLRATSMDSLRQFRIIVIDRYLGSHTCRAPRRSRPVLVQM